MGRFSKRSQSSSLALSTIGISNHQLRREIEHYQQEVIQDPDSDLAYYNLAVALQKQDLLDAAQESYQIAIRLNPEAVNAYINLGLIWVQKENWEAAIITFKQVNSFFTVC